MYHDLEVVVPVCRRFIGRIEDFKKYGIVNVGDRSVLMTLITSDESIEGLTEGWKKGVKARVQGSNCNDHVTNLYRYYARLKPDNIKARWVMRVDDDSCTDVDNLISNLDEFYDWDDKFYLGDLNDYTWAIHANESEPFQEYKHLLGNYENILWALKNETECGIVSYGGLIHLLNNERAFGLIKKRSELRGGYGDCVMAIAAALAKMYPVQCPFLSHLPLMGEFSLFGSGVRNHIHLVSRDCSGENFDNRAAPECFRVITKVVDNNPTENEQILFGKKFLFECPDFLKLYEFRSNYSLKVKFEDQMFQWMEEDGVIKVLNGGVVNRFEMKADGTLVDGSTILRPVNI